VPRVSPGLGFLLLAVLSTKGQFEADTGDAARSSPVKLMTAGSGASGLGANERGPRSRRYPLADQAVQLSVAGLVVAVAAPPVAVTAVKEGIEK
jgi:hypothetical protein